MGEINGLVGPSNWLRSGLVDFARSINLRTERATPGDPKAQSWLGCTPGLRHVVTVGPDPVECLFWVIGRVFGVSGTIFFELMPDETIKVRGTVAHDGIDIATMASGGDFSDSVLIIAGGHAYVYTLSTDTFAEQTMPQLGSETTSAPITPRMCEFFSTYFLVAVRNSRTVFWSEPEDASNWPNQNFFSVSWSADPISFIKRVGTHLWVVCQKTAEIWYATGDPTTIFAPVQEALIEHGCIAPFSGQRLGENSLVWLDRNEPGGGLVVTASGMAPTVVSTYAVAWQQQAIGELTSTLDQSVGIPMQLGGHLDYVLLNRAPSAIVNTTPVFDFTEGLWHERGTWNAKLSQWQQYRIMSHVYAFQRHYGGDYRTGAIYQISSGYFDEQLVDVP